jgi:hypothetical protein
MISDRPVVKKSIYALLAVIIMSITACSGQTGKRATQGAATGAAAGAVGGVVSALIFGGNVGDAAARGAVWGASTGAVSGAIVGSQEDKALKKQEEASIKKLKAKLGEDVYLGLVGLVQCKHMVAISYAQVAQKLDNKDYALAGQWLETLTYADQGDTQQARKKFPVLISADPNVQTESDANQDMQKGLQGIVNIREQHNLAGTCAR